MKIIKSWIFNSILATLLYFILLFGLWYGNSAPPQPGKWAVNFLLAFIAVLLVILVGAGFNGRIYYEYSELPITAFTIYQFSNIVVLANKDHAWTFHQDREKIANLKKMKIITYYDIKKQSTGWLPVPYRMSELEDKKDEKPKTK